MSDEIDQEMDDSIIRIIPIKNKEFYEDRLLYFDIDIELRFVKSYFLTGYRNIRLFCTHPVLENQEPVWQPSKEDLLLLNSDAALLFYEIKWQKITYHDDLFQYMNFEDYASCLLSIPGSHKYFFTLDGSHSSKCGGGYFIVNPCFNKLQHGLAMNQIMCQTFITKLMGPFRKWEEVIQSAILAKYNMIHLTPIQELGKSNSSYCIKDQLKINQNICGTNLNLSYENIGVFLDYIRTKYNILSITDVVLNHTATDSEWLDIHPECSFNCKNSPHLRPAYLLNCLINHLSIDTAEGKYKERDLDPKNINNASLPIIEKILHYEIFHNYKIHEMYLLHVEHVLAHFEKIAKKSIRKKIYCSWMDIECSDFENVYIIQDNDFARLNSSVDLDKILSICHNYITNESDQQTNLKELKIFVNTTLKNLIWDINSKQFEQIKIHLLEAIKNVLANIKWRFIDENGPRYKSVTKDTPFQWSYFKDNGIVSCLKDEETYMKSHGEQIMANNGWVMNDDPMRNFAGPNSWVYLRRELIPWGDNVKLNYGTGPADVPYLYDRMTEYIQNIASVFDGIRLDNCHSTPIHVCEYLLREARKVNPNLYVVAELFTNNEKMDNIFINKLGIHALIRESIHAINVQQMCTNIYNYGGKPMGSFMEQRICLARESKARALLADQTHDNQPIIDKYNLRQFLPMMAVVSMVNNSICSNRGFDELVPYHIDVVTEKNMYQDCYYLSDQVLDLIKLRKIFNDFHMDISRKETFYNEIYTDEFSENIISIKRYDTTRHSSLVLLAHMDFSDNKKSLKNIKGCSQSEILKVNNNYEKLKKKCHYVYDIHETDVFHEILFEGSIDYAKDSDGFVRDNEFITGILDSNLYFKDIPSYGKSRFYDYKHSAYNKLVLNNFLPGSVMIFRLICSPPIEDHFMFIEEKIKDLQNVVPNVRRRSVSFNVQGEINDLAEYIDLVDLNYILFKADKEIETYDVKTVNNSVYNIPMYGPLIFSGLVGIESLLCKIRRTNDIGHAMCQNILKGCWLLDYIVERLNKRTSCADLGKWFECIFECIKSLPNHQLLPYFDIIIKNIVLILQMKLTLKMSNKISNGSVFLKKLAFSSVSFIGCQHDSTLPIPNKKYLKKFKRDFTSNVTLAAGFPHFTTGLFRMWGRDTCISIPGVLLITNRRELALDILMSFASVIYKGLVPNLIDGSGKYTRYNCRDASWFWLYSVRYYDETSKTSDNILDFYLIRKGIINILKNHAKGISFTEKAPNGDFSQLDRNMALEGFKIEAGVDWDTGFVYGGNPYNCGTWMDKMGESTWGNNKGRPSTPRNGSSIELVGLCYSALKWLNKKDLSRWKMPNGVNRTVHGVTSYISFYDWAALIKENFQKYFFIPYEPEMKEYVEAINNNKEPYILQRKEIKYEYDEYSDDSSSNESFHEESFGTFHPTYAKRFCMYIDTLNDKATSYKIRPNFFIAVVVATDLFDVEHIYNSVIYSAIVLLGTLGIKTLDKTDPDYRGSYDMQDSSDTNTACGFNYHQGPEWLWLTGYYCMARLITSKNYSIQMKRREYMVDALMEVDFFISRWHKHLDASEWKGVPELTNKQGEYCPHSCSSQLWSVATMMEAVLVYNEVRHFYKNFKIT